ncbi:MAG: hypothetical protein M3437_19205 [Chloroflexota bacterium]|nr:hypothetical protein [Chloroflexota bacterium]MDQ5867504.1 hypothetical protein [Chloroflexota bacterium]
MQTNIRTGSGQAAQANQLYTVAGISALLYIVVSLAMLAFTDWNNPAATNTPLTVLGVLSFVVLLPVILAVCQHLRPASSAVSSIALVSGVLALIGGATGSAVGYDTTIGIVGGLFASFGMLLFFGLSGYLALTSKLLPAGWAILSIVLGILAVSAGIISGVAGSNSDITGYTWTVFGFATMVWAAWTAVEFMRRGRAASTTV